MHMSKKLKKNKLLLYSIFGCIFFIFHSNAIELKGNFIQGGLLVGKVSTEDIVYYNGDRVPIDETGEFILGLGRKHPKKGQLKIIKDDGNTIIKNIIIKQREYKVQKINNLNKDKVTPPKEYYDRIKNKVKIIKKAKSLDVNYSYYHAGFMMPAEGLLQVSMAPKNIKWYTKRPHYGIDIANKPGSPILAPSDGIVVMTEEDLYFSGATIILSHGRGLTSSLLHLKEILVEKGSLVKKGQLIGLMGATGRATGSHLDWRMELEV